MNVFRMKSGKEYAYLNEVEVRMAMDENDGMERFGLELEGTEHSDITRNKYEGGFKIWECTVDLCEFIEENASLFTNKRVLELGCGAAIPSILAATYGAAKVVAQDFNESVIEFFTKPNFEMNEIAAERVRCEAMSWKEVPSKLSGEEKFDIILSSETIYNEDDYESLCQAIESMLADDGVAWFAAKFFYFGVGGSVPSFCEFVNKRKTMSAKEIKSIEESVPRRIVEIRRVSN